MYLGNLCISACLPIAERQATLVVRQLHTLKSPTISSVKLADVLGVSEPIRLSRSVDEEPMGELQWSQSTVPSPAGSVICEESSGASAPHSAHKGNRKRLQPLQPTAAPMSKRSLPFDDVEVVFGRPSTSAGPAEVEPTPGPSGTKTDPSPQPTPTATTSDRTFRQIEDPEDIENYLDYMVSDDEDFDQDEEEGIKMQEPIYRNCEAEYEEVAIPGTLRFREWPPRAPTVLPAPPTEEPQPELSSVTDQNLEKFAFVWKSFPSPAISPSFRREVFSDINVGPTVRYATPYDAFTAIWNEQIMGHIADETNRHAQVLAAKSIINNTLSPNSRMTRWKDTNVSELYTFLALILAMGIMGKSVIQEYWQKVSAVLLSPGFAPVMSYNRFYLLSKCLHFNNYQHCSRAMSNSDLKLFLVKPIVDHLNNKFSNLYNLSQDLSLDESVLMWNGWLNNNQNMPDKAATAGIKTYELCESQTGYTWRFIVHTGQDFSCSENAGPVSGQIPSLVLKLLKGLEGRGHTVWMNNYYNSPALARELKTRGFDCVGTLRTNRQFVPAELRNLTMANMVVGDIHGCTSGDVDILVWRDKARVAVISTYHGAEAVKYGDKFKPSIVPDYNISMGGVDRKETMLSHYPIERKKSSIWYKKFFRRLLNVSVLNAYILYRKYHKTTTHRQFRVALLTQLLERHQTARQNQIQAPAQEIRGHFAAQYDLAGRTGKGQHLRRICVHCKTKRTTCYCIICNKPLCLFTCFNVYKHEP